MLPSLRSCASRGTEYLRFVNGCWIGSKRIVGLDRHNRQSPIAACGLAQGLDLPATVAPFILRNVALLGVESVNCPKSKRIEAWNRLVHDLDHKKLESITRTISFEDIIPTANALLEGKVRGRVVVEV